MRASLSLAFAVAAALALAAPAAAQPNAARIMAGAREQARQNVPAGVTDYVMTFTAGPVRTQLYVHCDGDGWQVVEQDDAALADLFQGMIIWPRLAPECRPGAGAPDPSAPPQDVRYVGRESVEGRAAHVLMARMPGLTVETMPIPDSARVFVDARTRQVLRVSASADIAPSEGGAMARGGHMDMEMTFGGYESINGITLPRRMRMILRIQVNLTDAERTAMRDEMAPMLERLAADTSEEGAQTRMLIEMFVRMLAGEAMDVSATLEDVQVNAGRPAWMDEEDG